MSDLADDAQLLSLSAALDHEPNNPEHFFARGKRRADLGDYAQAIEDFDRAIALSPRTAAYYVERGDCYHWSGDTRRCLADENRAIELDPYQADYYVRRGRSSINLRAYDEAVRDFSRALRLEPEQAETYFLRGTAYARDRDWQHAVADCCKAVELEPECAEYQAALGMAYICEHGLRDDYDRSIEHLRRAVELAPENVNYRLQRAHSLWIKGRFGEAIADYDAALLLEPQNAHCYALRGIAKRQQGDRAAALDDLRIAATLGDPLAKREMHPLIRFLNSILSKH
ncbi:MAG: tetratricopeptide repeat protein [Chloroflexi bacterium]|nr:tetratricopeptide repeat protein [Chloroflexota bacterium]